MSDVIKRGRLEVKKRNLFGSAYKNRCVLLRNSLALNCKTVEILEGEEEVEESKDVIRLSDVWSVQDKPSKSKGRFTFELIKGDEVILTFACGSMMERDEWTESFRILNQLALSCETGQPLSKPITDYFQVILLKNRHAVEINHSGSYLLSITDAAIVLHWKTGAIAHHWPKRSVVKFLHHPKKEGHLILHAKKSGSGDVVDFEFTTSPENSMQILKTWNIRLMESITFNPQQLNEISSVLNTSTMMSDGKQPKGRGIKSRSFRASKHNSVMGDQQDLRRADSFSKLQSYRTDIGGGTLPPVGLSQVSVRIGGLPPLPREANTRSWGGDDHFGPNGILGALSQDSVFTHSTGLLAPPPLPPRPNYRSKDYGNQDIEDPDYAYIKEDEVEGPRNGSDAGADVKKHRPSISVDDVLNRLEQDIMRENRVKKEEEHRKRVMTLDRVAANARKRVPPMTLGPRVHIPPSSQPKPQDYMDFIPTSQRPQVKSTSSEPDKPNVTISHAYSASEPDPGRVIQPLPARIGTQPPAVFESNDEVMDSLLPRQELRSATDYSDFMPSVPALPPRSWRNASSSSSNPGNDLSENAAFTPIREVSLGESGTGTSDGLSDGNGVDKPVSPAEACTSQDKKLANQATPSSGKENAAPPTSAPEATLSSLPTTTTPEQMLPLATPPVTSVPEGGIATPPPLPPRSPTKERLFRKSSSSSTSSASSTGRCPRCRSLRKSKASVSKTVSLDQRSAGTGHHDDCRKSMPDLADAKSGVLENNLGGKGHHHAHNRVREHSHCSRCSPVLSTDTLHGDSTPPPLHSTSLQNFDYLQLVGEEHTDSSPSSSSIENELGAEMDLLNSCLQTLEYLENKMKATTSAGGTDTMTSVVSHSTANHTPPPTTSHWMTGSKTFKPAPHGDVKRSVYTKAKTQAELALAELNQPLHKSSSYTTPNGHAGQLGKQNSMSTMTSSFNPRPRGHPNIVRSTSSTALITPTLGHTPPIPPRSVVSLTDPKGVSVNRVSPKPQHTHSSGQLHSQAPPTSGRPYNRSVSSGNMGLAHHPPLQMHAPPTRGHPSLTRHHHQEAPGQSSTVFIHHIKDRRVGGLTHLV